MNVILAGKNLVCLAYSVDPKGKSVMMSVTFFRKTYPDSVVTW
jgi:hypothetical protein